MLAVMGAKKLLCVVAVMALAAGCAFAEGYPKISMYVQGGPHFEERDLVGTFINVDATAGIGLLVWDWFDLYVGLRLGVFSETVATAYMAPDLGVYYPFVAGAEVYFLYPFALSGDLVWTCGVATDNFLYLDSVHWNPSDFQPTYWYVEVYLGLRYYIARRFHVEARVAGGTMPLFDSPPTFVGVRLLAGLDL